MKNLRVAALCVCLGFGSPMLAQTTAKTLPVREPDYNKPRLFADLPDKIQFNPDSFTSLFTKGIAQVVSIPLTSTVNFSGKIVSRSSDANSSSVVIGSTNRPGARLVLTRVNESTTGQKFIGRIISFQHGDSYELISENNQYYFKKKGLYDLISE
ncbi:MAG TPA: hypothetical protein VGC95_03025 [Chitinophagaceae bacterium]